MAANCFPSQLYAPLSLMVDLNLEAWPITGTIDPIESSGRGPRHSLAWTLHDKKGDIPFASPGEEEMVSRIDKAFLIAEPMRKA